jgi:hypothetical protein
VLSCAAALHAYDRSHRSGRPFRGETSTVMAFSAAGIAFVICAVAVLLGGETGIVAGVIVGSGTLGALFIIRQWSLGVWGKAGLAAAGRVLLFSSIILMPGRNGADPALPLTARNQISSERMLADASFAGSGAGTYEALAPIYRGASKLRESPTTAAVMIIEMGRPFFVGLIIALLWGAALLFRRALERRRDYVFPGIGAALATAAPILVLGGGGASNTSLFLVAGALGGVSVSQSISPRRLGEDLTPAAALARGQSQGMTTVGTVQEASIWPRWLFLTLSVILMLQAAWILGAEFYMNGGGGRLIDAGSSGSKVDQIQKAALIGVVRGDLWVEAGRAQISRREPAASIGIKPGSAQALALEDLNRAVRFAPHRSDAWLMLATIASWYRSEGYDPGALLKMSYYTAPNDAGLLPLRLTVALALDSAGEDPELRDILGHDINYAVSQDPTLRPALAAAYRSASPSQKLLAERLISEIDPAYMKTIRSR